MPELERPAGSESWAAAGGGWHRDDRGGGRSTRTATVTERSGRLASPGGVKRISRALPLAARAASAAMRDRPSRGQSATGLASSAVRRKIEPAERQDRAGQHAPARHAPGRRSAPWCRDPAMYPALITLSPDFLPPSRDANRLHCSLPPSRPAPFVPIASEPLSTAWRRTRKPKPSALSVLCMRSTLRLP